MKETLELDEILLNRATELTGITEKTALITAGLKSLIMVLENIKQLSRKEIVTKTPSPVAEYWLQITAGDEQLKQARQEFAAGQWIEVADLDELFQ